jgi:hypothetical protein
VKWSVSRMPCAPSGSNRNRFRSRFESECPSSAFKEFLTNSLANSELEFFLTVHNQCNGILINFSDKWHHRPKTTECGPEAIRCSCDSPEQPFSSVTNMAACRQPFSWHTYKFSAENCLPALRQNFFCEWDAHFDAGAVPVCSTTAVLHLHYLKSKYHSELSDELFLD